MKQFDQPEVGKQVEVVVKNIYHPGKAFFYQPETTTYIGTVFPSEARLESYQFNLTTGLPDRYKFPIRTINLRNVVEMNYVTGEKIDQHEVIAEKVIEEIVQGSKDNTYLVKKSNGKWTCTCPGFMYNKHCKHIKAMKEKHDN